MTLQIWWTHKFTDKGRLNTGNYQKIRDCKLILKLAKSFIVQKNRLSYIQDTRIINMVIVNVNSTLHCNVKKEAFQSRNSFCVAFTPAWTSQSVPPLLEVFGTSWRKKTWKSQPLPCFKENCKNCWLFNCQCDNKMSTVTWGLCLAQFSYFQHPRC